MLIYPPLASPAYSRGRIRNPNLTPAQRHRRHKKYWKRKMRRHDALLNSFISPLAIYIGYQGLVPRHLQDPETRPEMRRYIADCNAVFYHSFWSSRTAYLNLLDGQSEVDPKVPRRIGMARDNAIIREGGHGYFKLKNLHTVMLPTLFRWFTHGFLRYAFRVLEEKSIRRASGEWSLMYPEELQAAFPSIDIRKNGTYRACYLVNCLRGDSGVVNELRVYSQNYTPVFRIMIELVKPEGIPEVCRPWWSSRLVPLPPYRMDLSKPVTELDEEGLPKVPIT